MKSVVGTHGLSAVRGEVPTRRIADSVLQSPSRTIALVRHLPSRQPGLVRDFSRTYAAMLETTKASSACVASATARYLASELTRGP
jgi:hypothetical protein